MGIAVTLLSEGKYPGFLSPKGEGFAKVLIEGQATGWLAVGRPLLDLVSEALGYEVEVLSLPDHWIMSSTSPDHEAEYNSATDRFLIYTCAYGAGTKVRTIVADAADISAVDFSTVISFRVRA